MSETKPLAKPPGFREPGLPIQKPKPPPLRKPNLPPSFYPQKKPRSCCCRFCCCFIIFTLLLTLFFISFGGFFYLWYEPRVPTFGMKSFQVKKFNVTNTREGPALDSQISIGIEFRNTNRNIKLDYDRLSMSLNRNDLNGDLKLGQGTVPGFIQRQNNVTVVKFTVKGNQRLNDQDAKRLRDQFRAKSLMMSMELETGIGLELSGLNTGTLGVKVVCGPSPLKKIQDGAMPSCGVYVFSLVNVY